MNSYHELKTIKSLQSHIITQDDKLMRNFSYDEVSRFKRINAAVKGCRREARERKLQFF